jgi:uncharacterized membrane protein
MTERFEKAYNSLLKAFMNDTLASGSCSACAMGNIIADAMGGVVYKDDGTGDFDCNVDNAWWKDVFVTGSDGDQTIYKVENNGNIKVYRKRMFELTGYEWHELARIEKTFENNTKIKNYSYPDYREHEIMEDQFNGLMAVMDVLIELDDVKDGQKYKDQFKAKLQTV